jgi:hypothetical protein
MAYGGLRGGIAFFLAMSLSADIFPQRKLFITTTIVVVYFTVIILVIKLSKSFILFIRVIVYFFKKPRRNCTNTKQCVITVDPFGLFVLCYSYVMLCSGSHYKADCKLVESET